MLKSFDDEQKFENVEAIIHQTYPPMTKCSGDFG
jgi:hypothetical protein